MKKNGATKKKNGITKKVPATKDKLSENDRLSMLVARERHGRCTAEVAAFDARITSLRQTLEKAQQSLVDATEKLRAEFTRIKKTYKLEDDTPYNLDTGDITREKVVDAAAAPK